MLFNLLFSRMNYSMKKIWLFLFLVFVFLFVNGERKDEVLISFNVVGIDFSRLQLLLLSITITVLFYELKIQVF